MRLGDGPTAAISRIAPGRAAAACRLGGGRRRARAALAAGRVALRDRRHRHPRARLLRADQPWRRRRHARRRRRTAPATQGESTLTAEQRRVLVGRCSTRPSRCGARSSSRPGAQYRADDAGRLHRGTTSRAAARRRRRWGRSTARPTSASTSTRPSSTSLAAASARRATSPRPMSSPTRSATTSRTSRARSTGPRRRRRVGQAEGNQVQVGVELQADCYAGVWAARARRARLEPGDIEEGMRAAEAIGDDTLQRQSQGVVVPESFTHGTSAQRMEALRRGLQSGNPGACTYS